ncbi:MAG TPA: glycerol kinase [bacterium]|nr:glycerol kinase [bacterium]HPS28876.1 glycerol kinase [bacterium]
MLGIFKRKAEKKQEIPLENCVDSENTLYFYTSKIAYQVGLNYSDFTEILTTLGWIKIETREKTTNKTMFLLSDGLKAGGKYKKGNGNNNSILRPVWPIEIIGNPELINHLRQEKYLTATDIGLNLEISSKDANSILKKLSWIEKNNQNQWMITKKGMENGGKLRFLPKERNTQPVWNESILTNKDLLQKIKKETPAEERSKDITSDLDFRKKYPAEKRTDDGHYVRSKSEVIIDNWLYSNNLVHCYEKKLPISEGAICDFYLPQGDVYIEFWGYENKSEYLDNKKRKIKLYEKNNFKLLELNEESIDFLDDVLPQKLLKFGIDINKFK